MTCLKRIAAVLLAVCMLIGLTACHQKNETVMTVGDVKISSGTYLMLLLNATSEFQSKVKETLKEDEEAPENLEGYLKLKLDKKDADTWIKDRTAALCKEYAWTQATFKEKKLELGDYATYPEYYTSMYWESYGQSAYYELNGVSRATFLDFYTNLFQKQVLFEYFYGEGGPEAVSADTIKQSFVSDYLLVESFTASLLTQESSEESSSGTPVSDAEKAAIKAKLDALVTQINSGALTVKQASDSYNNVVEPEAAENEETESTSSEVTSSEATSSEATSSEAAQTEEKAEEEKNPAVYPDAVVVGEDDTSGMYTLLKDTKEFDKAAVYEDTENSQYIVALLRDPAKDYEHYAEEYRLAVLHNLKDEAFEQKVADESGKLKTNADASLVKYYAPKKIKEVEQQAQ